mgnify:CR=1 FL=1
MDLEREQINHGGKLFTDSILKLESQSYASATEYGVACINARLPEVVELIESSLSNLKKLKMGHQYTIINKCLTNIDTLGLAAITCKVVFDKVFGHKDSDNHLVTIVDAIGSAVEAECQLKYYEDTVPGLYNYIKKQYWHESSGTKQRHTTTQTLMNRYGKCTWNSWGSDNKKKIGGWLFEQFLNVCEDWFTKIYWRHGGKKSTLIIVPSAEFIDQQEKLISSAMLYSPILWPMLVKPKPWGKDERGGYYNNAVMYGHDMIRRASGPLIQEEEIGDDPIKCLNTIQDVGYRLNSFIVGVAETLEEKRIKVGKFIPIMESPIPPKPPDIAENKESRQNYKREAAIAHNKNASAFRRSCRTRCTMEAVRKFKDVERYYIPWSFDYRGRIYPIPSLLTPQDTDFGKSLIVFADGSKLTDRSEHWLSFQVATTYGLDKSTIDERIQWVKDNLFTVKSVATDPIGNIGMWEGADEPWQFLAACEEYYHCVVLRDRYITTLPVATDATCSGLQILAGMAKDRRTAQLVNVLPSDRPQDAYKVVANASKHDIPEHLHPVWDRKCVKRVVMTIPYNAKPHSNRKYIKEALKDKGVEISSEDLTLTVKAVRNAMDSVVPGPMSVMKWIEKEVSNYITEGNNEIKWVTPSGFCVSQIFNKRGKPRRLKLQLLGLVKVNLRDYTDEADVIKHKAATAPNLIHSLDASLLHLATIQFNNPIALIHDSVLCRATDMDELSCLVRKTYMNLFAKENVLETFAEAIKSKNKLPIIGDLEPSDVIDSTYFFC